MGDKVWAKNDACLAYCSEDGEFHAAVIRRVRKQEGQVRVEVQYDGYGSQDNEILTLDQIRPAPAPEPSSSDDDVVIVEKPPSTPPHDTTIFGPGQWKNKSPLKRRLEALDDEVIDITPRDLEQTSRLILQGARLQHERLDRPAKLAKTEPKEEEEEEDLMEDIEDVESPVREPTPEPQVRVKKPEVFRPLEGFSERDIEKPRLPFEAPGDKVPHVLRDHPRIQVPASLNQYLREYQREGISFLYDNYARNRGALLLDDMGLGKTVQVIGFLSAVLYKSGTARDLMKHRPDFIRKMSEEECGDALPPPQSESRCQWLIVCPGSVLYNWSEELETWGYFSVGRYHQSQKERTLSDAMRGKLEIVITTFETLRENVEDLNRINWDGCIVDEVHKIKGSTAQVTQALSEVKTRKRLGLTGTALQNNMMELYTLLNWANPGCLGSEGAFQASYADPIERGQKYESSKRELAEARSRKEEFASMTKDMMLRRMKTLIADQLPKKYDQVVYCRLSVLQRDVYKAILAHPEMRLVLNRHNPCWCGSRQSQEHCCGKTNKYGNSIKSIIFSFMHLLLKASNHPAMLLSEATPSKRQRRLCDDILSTAFAGHDDYVKNCRTRAMETLSDPEECGKMKVLRGLLKVFKQEDAKVLLFSYSTKALDIMEAFAVSCGYEYSRLDGSVSEKRRQQLVTDFNRDPHIFLFLISTKAGGVGLNLTGANVVIIYDPNWNPTHDLQAQDRAYRIGQQRDVRVFRLITTGTIEENMYLRQIYKQQLDTVAVASENARRYFRTGELFGVKNMFSLRDGKSCQTERILKRNEQTETKIAGYDVADYIAPHKPDELPRRKMRNYEPDAEDAACTDDEDAESVGSSVEDSDFFDSESEASPSNLGTPSKRRRARPVADSPETKPSTSTGVARSERKEIQKRKEEYVKNWKEKSYGSVSDVFDECGVVHIHANRDVVGASRAEDHMSKCAIRDVYDRRENSQEYALECEAMENSEDQKTPTKESGARTKIVGGKKLLIGQTPKPMKRDQFSKMAAWCDVNESELARQIVEMTRVQRLDLLVEFYEHENTDVTNVFYVNRTGSSDPEPSTSSRSDPRSRTPHRRRKGTILHSQNTDDSVHISPKSSQERERSKSVKREESYDSLSPEKSNFMDAFLDELLGIGDETRKKAPVKRRLDIASTSHGSPSQTSTSMEPDMSLLDDLLGLNDTTRKPSSKRKSELSGNSSISGGSANSASVENVQSVVCDDSFDISDEIFNSNSTVRKKAPKKKTKITNDIQFSFE